MLLVNRNVICMTYTTVFALALWFYRNRTVWHPATYHVMIGKCFVISLCCDSLFRAVLYFSLSLPSTRHGCRLHRTHRVISKFQRGFYLKEELLLCTDLVWYEKCDADQKSFTSCVRLIQNTTIPYFGWEPQRYAGVPKCWSRVLQKTFFWRMKERTVTVAAYICMYESEQGYEQGMFPFRLRSNLSKQQNTQCYLDSTEQFYMVRINKR